MFPKGGSGLFNIRHEVRSEPGLTLFKICFKKSAKQLLFFQKEVFVNEKKEEERSTLVVEMKSLTTNRFLLNIGLATK